MTPSRHRWKRLAAAGFLAAGVVSLAETVTLHPVADTTLFGTKPTNNLGQAANLLSGTVMNGAKNRALLKFDPAAQIPAGARIESVKLELTVVGASSPGTGFALHRMLANWEEGRGTSNHGLPALPGETTFLHRRSGQETWDMPGAGAPADYAVNPSASVAVGGAGTYTFTNTPALLADVRLWVESPRRNFGWIVICLHEHRKAGGGVHPGAVTKSVRDRLETSLSAVRAGENSSRRPDKRIDESAAARHKVG
jgi:hypothetical protein